MDKYPEFIDPFDKTSANLFIRVEHLARYHYAAEFVRKRRLKRVLDAACGNGYGCRVLAAQAINVAGVDRNSALTDHGLGLNPGLSYNNISYHAADLNDGLKMFEDGCFDCAVCFEALEHIKEEDGLLREFRRVLRRGGQLLLSVPKAGYEPADEHGRPENPYHLRLYAAGELAGKLSNCGFTVERTLGQPYTNLSRANMESFHRDRRLSYDDIDGFFVETPESLEFFARVWGWPVEEDQEKSNVIFLECRRI